LGLPHQAQSAPDAIAHAPLSREDAALLRLRLDALKHLNPLEQVSILSGALAICSLAESELLGPALLEVALARQVIGQGASSAATGRVTSRITSPVNNASPATHEDVVRALRVKYGLATADEIGPHDQPARQVALREHWLAMRTHWRDLPRMLWQRLVGEQHAPNASDAARVALLRIWHRLPESTRAASLASDADPMDAQRWRLAALSSPAEAGIAQYVIDRGDPALADLLVTPLQHGATAHAAQHALLALAWMAQSKRRPEWMTLALQSEGLLPGPSWQGWNHRWSPDAMTTLDTTIATALGSQNSTRPTPRGALLASLVWLDLAWIAGWMSSSGAMGRTSAILTNRAHACLPELAGFVRTSRTPVARLRACQWLGQPDLPSVVLHACANRLSVSHGTLDHEALLQSAHLALRPQRAMSLRRVVVRGARRAARASLVGSTVASANAPSSKAPSLPERSAMPRQGELHLLSPTARRMLPTWARSIAIDAPTREAALAPLLLDEDATVRLSLIRRGVASLTHDLIFDPNRAVARSALLAALNDEDARAATTRRRATISSLPPASATDLTSRVPSTPASTSTTNLASALRSLHRSPHAALSAATAREERALGDALDDTPRGRLLALRRFAEDRAGSISQIRELLSSAHPARLATALRLTRLLQAWNDVEEPLLQLAIRTWATDARIAATAVALLGHVASPTAQRVLTSCLAHSDARVRANAVDALARHCPSQPSSQLSPAPSPPPPNQSLPRPSIPITSHPLAAPLAQLKADPHHRVRASAIRACVLGAFADARDMTTEPKHQLLARAALSWREDLRAMLAADAPQHRLAGVWLASRTLPMFTHAPDPVRAAHAELSQRILELANFDDDPRVRRRALAFAIVSSTTTTLPYVAKEAVDV